MSYMYMQYRKSRVRPIRELADCVSFYEAEPFRGFAESSHKISFFNVSESKVGKWIDKDSGRPFVGFNAEKLSRVYPAWWRLSSTNYNPIPKWMAGCQVYSSS